MRFQLIFILLFFCFNSFSKQKEQNDLQSRLKKYYKQEFKNDLISPLNNESAKDILTYGGIVVSTLILTRESTILPIQEWAQDTKPLGDYSIYGDLMGQLIPNLVYTVYQWKFSDSAQGTRRAAYMAKASLFAGGTTFLLKRIVNQKRPGSSKDRNSFPSGHTTTAFAFAGVIANEHPNKKWYAYGIASFVGLSRINDNAHYIHDVVMGATIGLAFAEALKTKSPLVFIPVRGGAALTYNQNF